MIEDVSDYKSYIALIKKLMTEYGASLNQADIQTLNDEATLLNNYNKSQGQQGLTDEDGNVNFGGMNMDGTQAGLGMGGQNMLGNNNVGGMGSSGSFMSSARADNIINQKDKKLKSFSIENKELKGTVSDLKKRNEILENERKNNNRNQCDLQKK